MDQVRTGTQDLCAEHMSALAIQASQALAHKAGLPIGLMYYWKKQKPLFFIGVSAYANKELWGKHTIGKVLDFQENKMNPRSDLKVCMVKSNKFMAQE